jgi:hypothetical protein
LNGFNFRLAHDDSGLAPRRGEGNAAVARARRRAGGGAEAGCDWRRLGARPAVAAARDGYQGPEQIGRPASRHAAVAVDLRATGSGDTRRSNRGSAQSGSRRTLAGGRALGTDSIQLDRWLGLGPARALTAARRAAATADGLGWRRGPQSRLRSQPRPAPGGRKLPRSLPVRPERSGRTRATQARPPYPGHPK